MTQTQNTYPVIPEGDRCAQLDAALDAYTRFSDDCPHELSEAIRYSLLGGGKRLRPKLVLLAAEACGGDWQDGLPAACAVEMIHAYSLIHDDLPAMDDDDVRRGRPACHKAFGEATAILAGDALLALAFQVIADGIRPPDRAVACCAALAQAAGAEALVGGQAADLAAQGQSGDASRVESIHQRKTGAMLCASARLGGLAVGAEIEQVQALDTYGKKLGLAFQITDDLLDVSGDPDAVGKRTGKDTNQGKLTFPGVIGSDASWQRAQALIAGALQAVEPFGSAGNELAALARSVLERDR